MDRYALMDIERVLFIKNHNTQYDVLHYFREGLTKALEALSVEVNLFDIKSEDLTKILNSIYRAPPDLSIGFNAPRVVGNGMFIPDYLEIPHVLWLVDSAHHFSEMAKSKYSIIVSPDQTSCDLFKSWGAPHPIFLPHAFDKSSFCSADTKRAYPIVILGSLINYLQYEEKWRAILPKAIFNDLMEAAEKVRTVGDLTFQKAFSEVADAHPDFFRKMPQEKIYEMINSFDIYIRGVDRVKLVQAMQGLPVHLFGNALFESSWKDYIDLQKGDYTVHEAVDFPKAVQIMQNAQLVLNSSPMFKYGAHERIFYALGAGAALMTSQTPWITAHFEEGEELMTYHAAKMDKAYADVKTLLESPQKRIALAKAGQAKVLSKHTWDVRAQELITAIKPLVQKIVEDN